MKGVVLIGYDPATVDYSDPALPPGMNAEKIHAGVKLALADIAGRGWHAENCFIKPDETAVPTIERCLADSAYDCVVIGAGVRLPPSRLGVFEAVVNAVHRAAPRAAIAFNTRPEDSGAAAARWI
jgi:hypothetical protein